MGKKSGGDGEKPKVCGDDGKMEGQRGWCALWSAEGKNKMKGKGWNRLIQVREKKISAGLQFWRQREKRR